MIWKSLTICSTMLFILACQPAFCQWSTDFSTGDLPEWSGDVDDFMVNAEGQLQLNAPDAGESYIFRQSEVGADTVSIGFYHLLDFSPSATNQSTIYLALDSEDLSTASGYFLQIGENGSEDALNVYYLNAGSTDLIATGTMGAMAIEPAVARIQIDIYPSGLWSINTNYDGGEFTSLDLDFIDDRFALDQSRFFGIQCKYTASRSDLFFYDDMFVKAFETDRIAPSIVSLAVMSANVLLVKYSEPVSNATDGSNYSVNNGIGSPSMISAQGSLGTDYEINFDEEFDPKIDYELVITDILDANDNVIVPTTIAFNRPVSPEVGDLLFSELLSDPDTDGEDFIEIYNASAKYIEMQGLILVNTTNDQSTTMTQSAILSPGAYVAISEDIEYLLQQYKPDPNAYLLRNDLPALNNDSGNITVKTSAGIMLDSFDYSDDMHFQLLDDTEGISLERTNFDIPTNSEGNWQSAAESSRFATPGYANSNRLLIGAGDEMFALSSEIFSPNQDGSDDQMVLTYALDKPGFVANISIHDVAGYKIVDLSRSSLLGSEGFITWDGLDSEGNIADIGMYIIVGRIFHPDGDVADFKKVVVLADFID